MENGTSLTNLVNESGYGGSDGKQKMTILNYKHLSYSHPNKRPVQSIGATSQTNSIPMMEQARQQAPHSGTILQHSPQHGSLQHSPQLQNIQHSPQLQGQAVQQQPLYNDKVHPQKMILQLQRDPKTGVLVLNNNPPRSHNIIQVQGPVASHGYHPGRHLHHQLQLKHTPQTQLQQGSRMTSHVQQQQQQQQPSSPHRNQFPTNQTFDNATYTRTYPQTNQQTYQYNTSYSPVRTRFISPNHPQYQQILAQSQQQHMRASNVIQSSQQQQHVQQQAVRQIQQQFPRAHIISSQTRYAFQNQSSSSQSVRTEKLSHFDYGEQDLATPNPIYNRTAAYKRAIENEDKSTLRKASVSTISQSSYNPNYASRQPTQIIGQLRPNPLPIVSQPNIISTQSNPQFQSHIIAQPNIISNQLRNTLPPHEQQPRIMSNRPASATVVVNQANVDNPTSLRPVILTAQQAGQTMRPTFPGSPVVLQINGGKSIKGSIVSLNNQQQNQPPPTAVPNNSTHVYFTIPQGNQISAAKFIKTPNGHLKPVNGIALQNSLNQSKMYTVRYAVGPKAEDGKSKQQFAIYTPVTPPNNNVKILASSPPTTKTEKAILPKSTPPSSDLTRKRKPTPGSKPSHPNKLTRIEPKPSPAVSAGHTELLQRVNKSLEADRDVVQRPDTNTPFESFPDAFRKLMKYHIYFEPDVKESYLRKVDKVHEDVSQKLLNRKMNIVNKLHSHLVEDAAQPLPNLRSSLDYITLLNQSILDEKEKLQEVKDELEQAKNDAENAQKNAENRSPDPEGACSDNDD